MKIVISGKMGEGKTTVACVVHEALVAAGFNVTKIKDLDLPTSNQDSAIAKRIASLTRGPKRTSIEIETHLLYRHECES